MKARIMKLKKEEERANKRIRDAYRRNNMIQEMNKVKEDKINTKANHMQYLNMVESQNREKFNQMRTQTKFNITSNRQKWEKINKEKRSEIKD